MKVCLNLHGIVTVDSATLFEEEEIEVPVTKESAEENAKMETDEAPAAVTIPPPAPIRIIKNLRICNDCHTVVKLISNAFDCEIVVRDRHRFHHFKHGSCSFLDFW